MISAIRVIDRIIDQADVSIINVQDNDVLSYNSTTGKWENQVSASGGSSDISKSFTYDGDGRLSVITDSSGTKTFSYNVDGTLSQITGTGPYYTKVFSYDGTGRLIGISVL